MDLQLHAKTALVTGASQGIGHAIAIELAREGAHIAIAARRTELLNELAEEITREGGKRPAVLTGDLARPGTPDQLATDAAQRLGRIDILINAAGGSRPIPFETPAGVWEEAMLVNFYRLRELTHAVIPGMRRNGYGRVVNLTGTSEPRGINAANSAKAAVHAWAKGLSREMARYGITINCIQPGRILSEQIRRMHPTEEDRLQFAEQNIPAGRFGEPHELAVLATFLASPVAGYITGAVIPVDGGMSRFAF